MSKMADANSTRGGSDRPQQRGQTVAEYVVVAGALTTALLVAANVYSGSIDRFVQKCLVAFSLP